MFIFVKSDWLRRVLRWWPVERLAEMIVFVDVTYMRVVCCFTCCYLSGEINCKKNSERTFIDRRQWTCVLLQVLSELFGQYCGCFSRLIHRVRIQELIPRNVTTLNTHKDFLLPPKKWVRHNYVCFVFKNSPCRVYIHTVAWLNWRYHEVSMNVVTVVRWARLVMGWVTVPSALRWKTKIKNTAVAGASAKQPNSPISWLMWWLALAATSATWSWVCIHRINRVNSRNGCAMITPI